MDNNLSIFTELWNNNILAFFQRLQENPWLIISVALDLTIVIFLLYKFLKFTKRTRIWQLVKGIILLVIITWLSGVLHLTILNTLLTTLMTYGIIFLIIIFQPELRRGLEELGTNKLTKLFGFDENIITKAKEDVYKVVVASEELAKSKTGALIVFERDIKLTDICEKGVEIDSEISPQLLVNIFVPKTPLHDGAVILSNNKIAAAACILPLIDDSKLPKKMGTRHRAALGISKETDSVAICISEETGKISVAIEGRIREDLNEEELKKILMKEIVEKKYGKVRKNKNA